MKVVGLDLSLTSTGVATVEQGRVTVDRINSSAPPTPRHPRTGKPLPPTLRQRSERIARIASAVLLRCEHAHLVVIEQPAFSKTTGSQHDRSGLWWLIVDQLMLHEHRVVEVTAGGVKVYATGKGNGGKDEVLAAVVRRYPDVEVSGNDEADALVLAAMGARWLGAPIEPSLPQANVRAMDGVRWPGDPS